MQHRRMRLSTHTLEMQQVRMLFRNRDVIEHSPARKTIKSVFRVGTGMILTTHTLGKQLGKNMMQDWRGD